MNNFKRLSNEEYCEKFYEFLKDKTQSQIVLFDTDFSDKKLYGKLYSKVICGEFTVIYSSSIVYQNNSFINDITNSRNELQYTGVYVEKVDKFFDVPYKLYDYKNTYQWIGENLGTIKKQFIDNCLQTIIDELQTTYKTTNDIPDTLIKKPISEEEIDYMDWKDCYTKNKNLQFTPTIDKEFKNETILNYILDNKKEINDFIKEFKTTEQYFGIIRYLKKYYLAKNKLDNYKPDEKAQIKKKLYEALIPLEKSVKTVKLHIMGRDENKRTYYKDSIEGQIIEASYSIIYLIRALNNKNYDISTYQATNWSIKTGERYNQEPIEKIYLEDITKITSNRTVIYEK